MAVVILCEQINYKNPLIVTWMLHQIFMYFNKEILQAIKITIPPIHPLYPISTLYPIPSHPDGITNGPIKEHISNLN